jgi:hypothetical protein
MSGTLARPIRRRVSQDAEFKAFPHEVTFTNLANPNRCDKTPLLWVDIDQFVFNQTDNRLPHGSTRRSDMSANPVLADRRPWRQLQGDDRAFQRVIDLVADLTLAIKIDGDRQRLIRPDAPNRVAHFKFRRT